MFSRFFGKDKTKEKPFIPSVLGLSAGSNFEIETLELSMLMNELVINSIDKTHIVNAIGHVLLDSDTQIFRLYTDTEGWLQVVCQGGIEESNIVDVKFFYYYDTLDISTDEEWTSLLNTKLGNNEYLLEEKEFKRVWTTSSEYHMPVHMAEKTYDGTEGFDETDQFTMLFDRKVKDDLYESLFLSAEEKEEKNGNLSRCLVISTGFTLSPAQLKLF